MEELPCGAQPSNWLGPTQQLHSGVYARCFVAVQGQEKQGKQVMYGQQPAGYALNPWETVNYADCHDGETLFDQVRF